MRVERIIYSVLIIVAATLAAVNWRKAALFQAENEQLRAQVADLDQAASVSTQASEAAKAAAAQARTDKSELMKLRGEVTQLRSSSQSAQALAVENERLKAENQKLKTGATAAVPAAQPAGFAGRDQFPRDSWTFAGYSSPEAALVSAIFAMKQGDPKAYLDSLSPDEQQRMAQVWQSKSEVEVANKHQSDVSTISGLRVVDRQNISPAEVVMNVYLEGPGRMEKIRMNQVGQDWKFGGFIRDNPQGQAAPVAAPSAPAPN